VNNEADNLGQPGDSDGRLDKLDRADMARLVSGDDAALNEEDAADATQEAFARVYQHRAKFDSGQRFATWLYAIATNLIKDRYRWRSRHPQVSLDAENETTGGDLRENLPEAGPSPGETLQTEERVQMVRRAVEALPEELRVPLVLSEYEDLSHAEVGAILKCSAKAVETRIYRARQQLRLSLAKLLMTG